jgi:hypothetical protein
MAIRKLHFLRMSLNSNYRSWKISLSCFTDKTIEKANCLLERFLPCCARGVPTVCVTRAGAGGGTPSDWENAKA